MGLFMTAVISASCSYSPAFAQVEEDIPTPVSPTSPLGIDASTAVGGTGIRLGATEIPSAGVSPLSTYSTGTIALPGSGTTCSTLVTSPSGLIGSTDTYDGGGMTMGSATIATAATVGTTAISGSTTTGGMSTGISAPSATATDPGMLPISGMSTTSATGTVGLSGMCGAGSSGMASTPSTPATSTTPTTPGGVPRTGVPLDSWEIANLGVSSAAAIPTLTVLPIVGSVGSTNMTALPVMPTITPSSVLPTTTTTTLPVGNSASSVIPALVPGLAPPAR
jgi:hypothetical protein